jgi:proteasome accessory factor A
VTQRLFGIETEYALTAVDGRGRSMSRFEVIEALLQLARETLPHLPDELSSGMFLQNGARFYLDAGSHPELATPEVSNPWDAVRYVQAGEQMLLRLVAEYVRKRRSVRVSVYRCNVDLSGAGSAWGTHESVMHQANVARLPGQIIPHLVSRLIYSGAGGFDNQSAGIEFMLSPRVAHLTNAVSSESTHSRGIFHTKDEPLCGTGSHRLHIICGESLCAELSSWLKIGTTALVVALSEAGLNPGDAVELRAPVVAMQTFARDPTCTAVVETVRGARLTALAIQRHYLALADAHVGDTCMPPWAAEVCRQWRAVLDRLEHAPESVATALDWAIKLSLYKEHVRRRGLAWECLPVWNRVVGKLASALAGAGQRGRAFTADQVLGARSPVAEEVARLTPYVLDHGLSWNGLGLFLRVRQELFEIDTRFGQLGDGGIFSTLDAAGLLAHQVPGVDNVEHAIGNPPDVPRARVRGETVRQLSGKGDRYTCDWEAVWDSASGRVLDLTDPFSAAAEWNDCTADPACSSARGIRARMRQHRLLLRGLERPRRYRGQDE